MKSKYICEAKMCKPKEVAAIPSTSMSPPSELIRGMKEFAFWAITFPSRSFWAFLSDNFFLGLKK